MPFRVVVGLSEKQLPPDVNAEARRRLAEVGDGLDAISPIELAVWQSLEESTLQIEVRGWRITYRVDRDNDVILAERASFVGS